VGVPAIRRPCRGAAPLAGACRSRPATSPRRRPSPPRACRWPRGPDAESTPPFFGAVGAE